MLLRLTGITLALIVVTLAALATAGALWTAPGEVKTPAGYPRNTSIYVESASGVRLAVDVWLPADLQPEQRLPAVIESTRYWRSTGLTAFGRAAAMLGAPLAGVYPSRMATFFNAQGFAMVTVDLRGTGASFGRREVEHGREEIADLAAVLDWVAEQPWSDGNSFGVGISYSGTTAELMTTTAHPSLRAVAPLYADFDPILHLVRPGGAYQPGFTDAWSEMVGALDRNAICNVMSAGEDAPLPLWECLWASILYTGAKPVEGAWADLHTAIGEHGDGDVAAAISAMTYLDSTWPDGSSNAQLHPWGRLEEIQAADVPALVLAGWFDAATADGALARYAASTHPQTVWIGPWSHGGEHDTDPFKHPDTPPAWTLETQLQRVARFFRRQLEPHNAPGRALNYYVMGGDGFRTTDRWPPAHLEETYFYFSDNGALSAEATRRTAYDSLLVDRAAGMSGRSRWQTQLDGGDVRDLQRADGLTYTGAPLAEATEITGNVVVDLWMTSTREDGALHTYLEAVAPDGSTVYLTGGYCG